MLERRPPKAAAIFAAVALIAAVSLAVVFFPPSPITPEGNYLNQPSPEYYAGGHGCQPSELTKLSGPKHLSEANRCSQAREDERQKLAAIDQAARSARAAEQGVIETFSQARLIAIQAGLLLLAFAAALWAAFETRKTAQAAQKALNDLERPWLYLESVQFERREHPPQEWEDQPDDRMIPYFYWITMQFRNSGRMLADIEALDIKYIEKKNLPASPRYTDVNPMNMETRFIRPGEIGESSKFGAPIPAPDAVIPDFVLVGRVRYKGLISAGHETGFALSLWWVSAAFVSHGGEAYNYHR